jgi:hypothetical protein
MNPHLPTITDTLVIALFTRKDTAPTAALVSVTRMLQAHAGCSYREASDLLFSWNGDTSITEAFDALIALRDKVEAEVA